MHSSPTVTSAGVPAPVQTDASIIDPVQRAFVAYQRGALAEAEQLCQSALGLKADSFEALYLMGIISGQTGRTHQASEFFARAVAVNPNQADAYYNLGVALGELGRHAEALQSYERAIALQPDHASAHWNLADCLLLLGDFARGWQEYEWRWKLPRSQQARREFQQPLWLGEERLEGRTILLHGEMGLGDTLLFCRYARNVGRLGGRVILEVQPPLLPLLARLEGVSGALPRGAPLPAIDCHCPLMSLPLAFRTELHNIPAAIPYIHPDPAQVARWRRRLGETSKPRIAFVWSGSVALKNDRRSMALADMLPLMSSEAEWVSVQKEVLESDAALLESHRELRQVGSELYDFADTAAVLELMDLVVTIDTSVANLAGAMGKPVWILLPFDPHDWRWLLDREDSPWYPTARLFRQPASGDWASVIFRIKKELASWFAGR